MSAACAQESGHGEQQEASDRDRYPERLVPHEGQIEGQAAGKKQKSQQQPQQRAEQLHNVAQAPSALWPVTAPGAAVNRNDTHGASRRVVAVLPRR